LLTLSNDEYLALRVNATVLERDLHGEKVLRLENGSYLKLFRRKRLISSAAWYPYAQRFADNALALKEKGIPCPYVIGVYRVPGIKRDAVHYWPLAGTTLRGLIARGIDKPTEQELKADFTKFVVHLHNGGVYFRSLHLGNVVLTPDHTFGLIDIADLRVYPHALGERLRTRNLKRLQGLASESGWVDSNAILSATSQRQARP
jgi:hypothetical protein